MHHAPFSIIAFTQHVLKFFITHQPNSNYNVNKVKYFNLHVYEEETIEGHNEGFNLHL